MDGGRFRGAAVDRLLRGAVLCPRCGAAPSLLIGSDVADWQRVNAVLVCPACPRRAKLRLGAVEGDLELVRRLVLAWNRAG